MNFGIIFLTLVAVWVTSEVMLIVLSRTKMNSHDYDKGSLKWLSIVIYTCITLAISFGFLGIGRVRTFNSIVPWIGLYVIVFGLIVRWAAIMTLRKYFTVNVVIHSDHRIIKTGLYRFVRHPSYSGAIISFFGLGMVFSNWISITVLVVPITYAFIKRSLLEEKVLLSAFGEEYANYRKASWVLFPWIY